MRGGGHDPSLKGLEPARQVKSITYCHDTYRVTTADGKTHAFRERNLRFRTDSSTDGPEKAAPAIMPAGMMSDRAGVIFAGPEEILKFVEAMLTDGVASHLLSLERHSLTASQPLIKMMSDCAGDQQVPRPPTL